MEQAMTVLERVIEDRVRKKVKVVKIQIEFMAGRSMTDVFFKVRQLQEK